MLTDLSIDRGEKPTYPQRAVQRVLRYCSAVGRVKLNKDYLKTIRGKDFTIISSCCIGGLIYHDLNIPFLTPTVNLAFDGEDFCNFCENLEHYLSLELRPLKTDAVPYPVGLLGDNVQVRFIHYNSFEVAREKWNIRKARVNLDKILIVSTDRDGMGSAECLQRFERLPYKKIMYTSRKYPQYSWAAYCPEFSGKRQVGIMTATADFGGRRIYEKNSNISELINSLYE